MLYQVYKGIDREEDEEERKNKDINKETDTEKQANHHQKKNYSVVQREIYLRLNEGHSKEEAYETARKEFYHLRMRQDIERVVAAEEAAYSGAIFGKSYMDIGLELEQQVLEKWKERATKEQVAREAFRSAASGLGLMDDDDDVPGESEPGENASAKT